MSTNQKTDLDSGSAQEYNPEAMREELQAVLNQLLEAREYLEEIQFYVPEEGATFQAMDYARVHLSIATEALEEEIEGLRE